MRCKPLNTRELEDRLDLIRRRLDGVSKGLLEVVQNNRAYAIHRLRVDFIHRTAYDYLHESAEMQSLFKSVREKEKVMLIASHAALAVLKTDDS